MKTLEKFIKKLIVLALMLVALGSCVSTRYLTKQDKKEKIERIVCSIVFSAASTNMIHRHYAK